MTDLCFSILIYTFSFTIPVYVIVHLITSGDDGDDDPAFDGMGDDD